jgi:hypothetical protein
MIVGRLLLDVFDVEHLRTLYNAKTRIARGDGSFAEQYLYKHVTGGDQANNMGMLLDWRACKENSTPFWVAAKQVMQQ